MSLHEHVGTPGIRRAARILGSSISFREVEESDAGFIRDLRAEPEKKRFLSASSDSVEDQIKWIRAYKATVGQAYFVICDRLGADIGCIRMYDAVGNSYRWGSWLLIDGLSPRVALESALLVYAYGKHLGFTEARIDVRQDNESVWSFHEKIFSAQLVSETAVDRFYVVSAESIDESLRRYRNLIPSALQIYEPQHDYDGESGGRHRAKPPAAESSTEPTPDTPR